MRFTKNRNAKVGKCILKIDGNSCSEHGSTRGFCRSCYTHMQRRGLLDRYGLPREDKNYKYTVDRAASKGICRIKVNGKSCGRESHCRGLCRTHYNKFRGEAGGKKFMLKRKAKGKDY